MVGLYPNPFTALGTEAALRRRVALVCAGCGAKGTIAATRFLLRMISKPEQAIDNKYFGSRHVPVRIPVRIVKGRGKNYGKGAIKWHDRDDNDKSNTPDEKFDVGNIEDNVDSED